MYQLWDYSTTGMIRHLRSCHSSEYQILQATQQHITTAKQGRMFVIEDKFQVRNGCGLILSAFL